MKYAFIIGSNAFITSNGIIRVDEEGQSKEILRIKSIYNSENAESHLSVDLDIEGVDGNPVKLINNTAQFSSGIEAVINRNSVTILKPDGNTLIHILQMDEDSAMALEHNIVGELEVNWPVTAIRIFGDFKAGGLNISAENEKLYINDTGYATSALAGKHLSFTAKGVLLT